MFASKPTRLLTSCVLALGLILGCGRAPMAPGSGDEPAGSPRQGALLTESAAKRPAESPAHDASSDDIPQELLDELEGKIVRTVGIVGDIGGSLTYGRWQVDIPPDAIEGTATVVMALDHEGSSDCRLEIVPDSKNRFSVPATLTVECPSIPSEELRYYVLFRFDPAFDKWMPVPGATVDLEAKTVSAPLEHFSEYQVKPGAGRSGW